MDSGVKKRGGTGVDTAFQGWLVSQSGWMFQPAPVAGYSW